MESAIREYDAKMDSRKRPPLREGKFHLHLICLNLRRFII